VALSHQKKTIVEASIVHTIITSYPELWKQYNVTLKTRLVHPVGGKYLVYYNPVENMVFSWCSVTGTD